MGVCRPSVFLALRAVGGYAVDISEITEHCGGMYLSKKRFRAGETSCGFHVGVHEVAGKALLRQLHGAVGFHFHIPEAVVGEHRGEALWLPFPAEYELVGLEFLSRLFGVVVDVDVSLFEPPVFTEHLAVGELECGASFAGGCQTCHSGDVLAHVEHIHRVAPRLDQLGAYGLYRAYCRERLGFQQRGGGTDSYCRFPCRCIEARFHPPLQFEASVVAVAAVDVVVCVGAGGGAPAVV